MFNVRRYSKGQLGDKTYFTLVDDKGNEWPLVWLVRKAGPHAAQ
jgi:hypothetical protein